MRIVNSPGQAKKLIGKPLGFVVDGAGPYNAGVGVRVTEEGKTIHTSDGLVFKWREAYDRFAIRGNLNSELVRMLPRRKAN